MSISCFRLSPTPGIGSWEGRTHESYLPCTFQNPSPSSQFCVSPLKTHLLNLQNLPPGLALWRLLASTHCTSHPSPPRPLGCQRHPAKIYFLWGSYPSTKLPCPVSPANPGLPWEGTWPSVLWTCPQMGAEQNCWANPVGGPASCTQGTGILTGPLPGWPHSTRIPTPVPAWKSTSCKKLRGRARMPTCLIFSQLQPFTVGAIAFLANQLLTCKVIKPGIFFLMCLDMDW